MNYTENEISKMSNLGKLILILPIRREVDFLLFKIFFASQIHMINFFSQELYIQNECVLSQEVLNVGI